MGPQQHARADPLVVGRAAPQRLARRRLAQTHQAIVLLGALALAALVVASAARGGGGTTTTTTTPLARLHPLDDREQPHRLQRSRSDVATPSQQRPVAVYVAAENARARTVEVLLFEEHALLSRTAPGESPGDAARRALATALGLGGATDVEFVQSLDQQAPGKAPSASSAATYVALVRRSKLDAAARRQALRGAAAGAPSTASDDRGGLVWIDVRALAARAGERRGALGVDALRLELALEPFILTAGMPPGSECPGKPGWRKP